MSIMNQQTKLTNQQTRIITIPPGEANNNKPALDYIKNPYSMRANNRRINQSLTMTHQPFCIPFKCRLVTSLSPSSNWYGRLA